MSGSFNQDKNLNIGSDADETSFDGTQDIRTAIENVAGTSSTSLENHLTDPSDAHDATAVSFAPHTTPTVTTPFAGVSASLISPGSNDWPRARTGSPSYGLIVADESGKVGVECIGAGNWAVYVWVFEINTSVLPDGVTITNVGLNLGFGYATYLAPLLLPAELRMIAYDFGDTITTADWVSYDDIASAGPLVATCDLAALMGAAPGPLGGGNITWTVEQDAMAAAINTTGPTRFLVYSAGIEASVSQPPAGHDEFVRFIGGWYPLPAERPDLQVTYKLYDDSGLISVQTTIEDLEARIEALEP